MAAVEVSNGLGAGLHRANSSTRTPYLVVAEFDWADAATAKGTAIAASDTIQAIDLPAGTVVLAAGIVKSEAPSGTVSVATFDLGITGGDVDNFADGFDYEGAAVGDYSVVPAGSGSPVVVGDTADTLDILIATLTGTLTGGKVTVWALVADIVPNRGNPGLTTLKS